MLACVLALALLLRRAPVGSVFGNVLGIVGAPVCTDPPSTLARLLLLLVVGNRSCIEPRRICLFRSRRLPASRRNLDSPPKTMHGHPSLCSPLSVE